MVLLPFYLILPFSHPWGSQFSPIISLVMKSGHIRPLLYAFLSLMFKHSFYIIPQFMVFLQVKFPNRILGKIFSCPQSRIFTGFFHIFTNFCKKIKKSACIPEKSRIYYASRLTRPVGQGVKTSPSHGENTSSILVLAALFSDNLNKYVKRTAYMASWSRG